jgi:pimeloyl-ACP methyl ester carboxylesterase
MTLYLLPGVGCDGRLFDRLDLEGIDAVKLTWPRFQKGGTLKAIAEEVSERVAKDQPHIIAGVSMGGMVAQELAAITHPQKVILISSWTGPHEWNLFTRMNSKLGLHNLIQDWSVRAVRPVKAFIDPREKSIDRLLLDMAIEQGASQLRRGTAAIMRWKGSPWQGPLVRIHGDKDIVTPLRFPVDHVVKGGQHVMVLTQAEEVGRALRAAISA